MEIQIKNRLYEKLRSAKSADITSPTKFVSGQYEALSADTRSVLLSTSLLTVIHQFGFQHIATRAFHISRFVDGGKMILVTIFLDNGKYVR